MELPQSGCVTIVGSNGSGKSSLARALEGTLELIEGERTGSLQAEDSARISFEQQLKLIEEDFQLRNSDANNEEEEKGITPRKLIMESSKVPESVVRSLCRRLKIEQLLDRPYSILSSGEGRKVLIARAVLSNKSMIIGIVNECELIKFGERNSILADLEFMQLQNNEKIRDVKLPEPPEDVRVTVDADPLVSMSHVIVRYQDKRIKSSSMI